jgi:predicted HicB family RNase H-like nuclease
MAGRKTARPTNKQIHLKVTPEEHKAFTSAASAKGLGLATWLRQCARAFSGLDSVLTELPPKREE